jgi:hypothetical protein
MGAEASGTSPLACSNWLQAKSLFYFFYDLHQSPTLGLAQRTGFHDSYHIANAALVLFVVRMKPGGLLHEFSIDRVFHFTFNSYSNGFLHFVAAYHTNPGFTKVSCFHVFFCLSEQ